MKRLVKAIGLILVGILLLWPRPIREPDSNIQKIDVCQAEPLANGEPGVCRYPIDRSLQQYRMEMGLELQRTA